MSDTFYVSLIQKGLQQGAEVWDDWIEAQDSIEEIEKHLSALMSYWSELPEGHQYAAKVAVIYSRLTLRWKELGKVPVKPTDASAKVVKVYEESVNGGELSLELSDVDPIVKIGVAKTLPEVLATVMAVRKAAIMAKQTELNDQEREKLSQLLDAKIEKKIQARLKGKMGEKFQAAYLAAGIKYGSTLSTAPEGSPVTPLKPTKTKTKGKAGAAPVTNWEPTTCKELLVVIPNTVAVPAVRLKMIGKVALPILHLVQQLADKEVKVFEKQGLSCPTLILRHNMLQGLVAQVEPITEGEQGLAAVTVEGSRYLIVPEADGTVTIK